MQQVTRTRETKKYADGGLIQTVKEKLFGPSSPPETITQKYARQDAERAAKSGAAATMAAPTPAPAPAGSAISDYAGGMQSTMQRREAAAGLKDGGAVKPKMIKGPGTGTSDSIPRNMRPGSYVMPADSTQKVGKVPVKVSNGESEYSPDQVHAIGAKVLDMVKGATHKPTSKPKTRAATKLADGGLNRPVELAFAGGGEIPLDDQAARDRKAIGGAVDTLSGMNRNAGAAIADVATMLPRGLAGAYDTAVVRPMRAAGINAAYTSPMISPAGADPASQTPFTDQLRRPAAPTGPVATSAAAATMTGSGRGATILAPGTNDFTGNPAGQVALPAGMAPSTAGAGRGTVNPPLATQTGAARPDLANVPSLNGGTGTAVDGAAGVRKFVTADGRTLYSNVAGADNDKLMSAHPGVQIAPAAAASASPAAASMSAGYDQPGVMSNGSGALILSGRTLSKDANDRFNASPSLSTIGNRISGREQARLANASSIADRQNATSRLNNQDSNATAMYSSDQNAATQRFGTNSASSTAAARLAMDTSVHAQDAPLKASAVKLAQQTDAARAAVLSAKTPEDKAAAEETLRTLQGKNDPPELYSTSVLPATVDALGNKTAGAVVITNKRTGDPRIVSPSELQQAAPAAMPPGLVVGAATKQADGTYDGPQGKKVTIKGGKVTGIQ